MPPFMFHLFYLTLHCVFTIYEIIVGFSHRLLEPCHEFLPVNSEKTLKITKTPRHLTVLLGPEEPSFKDLANLIVWCLLARISFVSFYDPKGSLRKKQDELHILVQQKKIASDHVIWHSDRDSVYKNGFSGRKIHVKVLSHEEGRQSVVDLTKSLARKGDPCFDIDAFDEGLKRHFEFPDPDMGVCCGKTFSLYGYPPWQIRVTEFFQLKTHHGITFDKFVDLLLRFNKCEQRCGK